MLRSALVESWNTTAYDECSSSCRISGFRSSFVRASNTGLQIGLVLEVGLVVDAQLHVGQHLHHARVAQAPLHLVEHLLVLVQVQQEGAQFAAFQHGGFAPLPLPLAWISSVRFSVARRMISLVNSFSSLMYFSLLPFLMR